VFELFVLVLWLYILYKFLIFVVYIFLYLLYILFFTYLLYILFFYRSDSLLYSMLGTAGRIVPFWFYHLLRYGCHTIH